MMLKNLMGFRGRTLTCCALLCAGLAMMVGCNGDEDVRVYTVSKADDHHVSGLLGPTGSQQANPAGQGGNATAGAAASGGTGGGVSPLELVEWTMPAAWHQENIQKPMVLAIFHTDHSHSLEVQVSAFPGDVGGLLNNINRWRGQLGQPAIEEGQLQDHVQIINTQGSFGGLVDIANVQTGQRLVVAVIQGGAGMSWFIRAMGPDQAVTAQKENIRLFAESFRFKQPGQAAGSPRHTHDHDHAHDHTHDHAHTHAPAPAPGQAHPHGVLPAQSLTFNAPAGWVADATPPAMVHAAYTLGDASGQGESAPVRVTFTRLGGDGGGLLPNINRWRGQLDLPPVENLAQQPLHLIDVPAAMAMLLDLTGQDQGRFAGQRMLMAVLQRPGEGWYIKATGPTAAIEHHKAAIIQAIESIRFAGGLGE